jgi:hypothetical protein
VRRTIQNGFQHRFRCEIDGKPGPDFENGLGPFAWSADGSTCIYRVNNQNIVYQGRMFGPFHQLAGSAISADGAHWAAFDLHPRATPSEHDPFLLTVDGQPHVLPPNTPILIESLQYDATSGQFVFQVDDPHDRHWLSIDAKPVKPPLAVMPPLLPSLPAGILVKVKMTPMVSKYGIRKVARQELLVKGRVIGDFDCVFGRRYGSKFQAGAVEPDGRLLFFIADDQTLYRLHVKP